MPKAAIIGIVVGAVVIIGGGVLLATTMTKSPTSDTAKVATNDATTKLVDPDGTYKFMSDPSVTKHPEKNAVFGNGQTFMFEYDGSKTNNDAYATLSYQLYYIQSDGKVQPMGGGNLDGKGSGMFMTSDKVFDSSASGASGFFELQGTYDTSAATGTITGKNVTLGMYPIKFEIAN